MKKASSLLCFVLSLLILTAVLPLGASALADEQTPRIAETVYPTDDVVVADIVATEAPYSLDRTGVADCTAALQNAIDHCYARGGGTVFLPVGRYRVTDSIYIKPFVTLRGDWQDPDEGTDYGTVILADVASVDDVNPALFSISGSAGVMGLTVYYPNQSIYSIKPYPYTFYINGVGAGYMLQSIINCTLLNSYRGIGICAEFLNGKSECHEMTTIENVKGTCLLEGMCSYNSADVDTVETLCFSPVYWAEAGAKYNAPSPAAVKAYTRTNGSALILGDLEWPELCNIRVSGYNYGIRFVKGPRASFSGVFYDTYITDCAYGVCAPEGIISARGKGWGIGFARGVIEGSQYAVYDMNNAAALYTGVELYGRIKSKNTTIEKADFSGLAPDYSHTYAKPAAVLYTFPASDGKTDVSAGLQALLNAAGQTGGVVYLPAGQYRMCTPVSVPSGVELRGSSCVPVREQCGDSRGTLIIADYGYDNINDKALITLAGDSSGIRGLRVVYPKNNPNFFAGSGDYHKTTAAVKVTGDGCYAVNCCVNLASVGFLFEGCRNFYAKKLIGCCITSFIKVDGCTDGLVEGCLQNATSVCRNGYQSLGLSDFDGWMAEDKVFDYKFVCLSHNTVRGAAGGGVLSAEYLCKKGFMKAK